MTLQLSCMLKPGRSSALSAGILVLVILFSCRVQQPAPSHATGPVVVYKTRKDYRDQVSVQLSADGRSVVAWPGRKDVLAQRPVELAGGYLLKRMVGNVFLSITIEEYAASTQTFAPEELMDLVMDRKPFLEIYECSNCSGGDTASLNQLIRQDALNQCKSLR